jgi:hypothetical protein
MEEAKDLLQGSHVSLRGFGLGRAKDIQRRGNISTRANGRVLKAAEEAGIDILSHSGKGRGGHVCETG